MKIRVLSSFCFDIVRRNEDCEMRDRCLLNIVLELQKEERCEYSDDHGDICQQVHTCK